MKLLVRAVFCMLFSWVIFFLFVVCAMCVQGLIFSPLGLHSLVFGLAIGLSIVAIDRHIPTLFVVTGWVPREEVARKRVSFRWGALLFFSLFYTSTVQEAVMIDATFAFSVGMGGVIFSSLIAAICEVVKYVSDSK